MEQCGRLQLVCLPANKDTETGIETNTVIRCVDVPKDRYLDRIDGIIGRCKIIGCVVDSVVFGRRKVFLARRADQQLERQGVRKDGSVWSFALCLPPCKYKY